MLTHAYAHIRDKFKELNAVYVPGSQPVLLAAPSQCVWKGFADLTVRHALEYYNDYSRNRKIKHLFRRVLGITDANASVYIDELRQLQATDTCQNVSTVYWELYNVVRTNDWEIIRYTIPSSSSSRERCTDILILSRREFEELHLVYVPSQNRWYALSSCLWTSALRVGDQVGIADVYADLDDFFIGNLGVREPTIANYVEQLRQLSRDSSPSTSRIKSAMQSINQLGPETADVQGLANVEFLPLRLGNNGRTEFGCPSSEFWIVDREEYGRAFNGKIHVLSFSLEENREFQQCLLALGLEQKYMSVAVQPTTTVQQPDQAPSRSLTRDFREKATALFRYVSLASSNDT